MNVAVVIPIYKTELSWFERISLEQCVNILKNHKIIFVGPEERSFNWLPTNVSYELIRFPKEFFEGIAGYNRLMYNLDFYAKFSNYDYILIYQLDAFVFSDRLEEFCELGYDYIGAVWPGALIPVTDNKMNNKILRVGNGGFSLRKVQTFIKVTTEKKDLIKKINLNEDIFYSLLGIEEPNNFKVAPVSIASKFAFECLPERYYKKNKYKLPFGCHGWQRWSTDFYMPHFLKYGFDLMPFIDPRATEDYSFKRGIVSYPIQQRLMRRLKDGKSLIKYLPQNEEFFVCVFDEYSKIILQILLQQGLKISNQQNVFIPRNEQEILNLAEYMKQIKQRILLITFFDDLPIITKLNELTGGGV